MYFNYDQKKIAREKEREREREREREKRDNWLLSKQKRESTSIHVR